MSTFMGYFEYFFLFISLFVWSFPSIVKSAGQSEVTVDSDSEHDCYNEKGNWTYTFDGEIKIGLLHSTTGTMAFSERVMLEAELLAVDTINDLGGVLGRKVIPVIKDGESDNAVFLERAAELINKDSPDYVEAVFGCWTSECRKTLIPVFEEFDHQLWYPASYEGQECSKHVFYGGSTPNLQMEPAMVFLLERYPHDDFYLLGSDNLFSHTQFDVVHGMLEHFGAVITGEQFIPLGERRPEFFDPLVLQIQEALPHGGIVLNFLNGDSNMGFYHSLHEANMSAEVWKTMSFAVTESEVEQIGTVDMAGHYATWSYFQSTAFQPPGCLTGERECFGRELIESSSLFLDLFHQKYGMNTVVTDPMEAAYILVHMWAKAVEKAGTPDQNKVRKEALGMTFLAPQGEVMMQNNHHLKKFVRIGKLLPGNVTDFDILYTSDHARGADAWSKNIEETKLYKCDHKDESKGEMYKIKHVKVALLHNLKGKYADVERHLLEMELLAIKEENADGGVNEEYEIVPTIYDAESDPEKYVELTHQILADDSDYVAVFTGVVLGDGGAFNTGMEAHNPRGLVLHSAMPSDAQDCDPYIMRLGPAPNQAIDLLINFTSEHHADDWKFFIVYSEDSVGYEHAVGELKKLELYVGEFKVSAVEETERAVTAISFFQPHHGIVLNLVVSPELNRAFFLEMHRQGLSHGTHPVCFTRISEREIQQVGGGPHGELQGHFLSASHVHNLHSTANTMFTMTVHDWFGADYRVSDDMVTAYQMVHHFFKSLEAVPHDVVFLEEEEDEDAEVDYVAHLDLEVLRKEMYEKPTPEVTGRVTIERNNYMSRFMRIATLNSLGEHFSVFDQGKKVYPLAYSPYVEVEGGAPACDFGWECGSGPCPSDALTDMEKTVMFGAGSFLFLLVVGGLVLVYRLHKYKQKQNPLYGINVQRILQETLDELLDFTEGNVADYIPALASAPPDVFAISLCDSSNGKIYSVGDDQHLFTIQSCCKPLIYALGIVDQGSDGINDVTNVEPSGGNFNDAKLAPNGKAFNPFINQGAIAVMSAIQSEEGDTEARFENFRDFVLEFCKTKEHNDILLCVTTYEGEKATADQNRLIAQTLRQANVIKSDFDQEHGLDAYLKACSVLIRSRDLAVIASTFANGGVNPVTRTFACDKETVAQVNSVMMTCGMYNGAGNWMVDVGLPAKSGVSGCIMAVVPGICGIGIFSPRLNANGNSARGIEVCGSLSKALGLHVLGHESSHDSTSADRFSTISEGALLSVRDQFAGIIASRKASNFSDDADRDSTRSMEGIFQGLKNPRTPRSSQQKEDKNARTPRSSATKDDGKKEPNKPRKSILKKPQTVLPPPSEQTLFSITPGGTDCFDGTTN